MYVTKYYLFGLVTILEFLKLIVTKRRCFDYKNLVQV